MQKIKKFIKRLLILLLIFLAIGVMLFSTLYFVLNRSSVQLQLTKQSISKLSKELNTTVEISSVDYKLFKAFALKGLYIEDLNGDTLLYAENFELEISILALLSKSIQINSFSIENAIINLKKDNQKNGYNFNFILEELLNKKDKSPKGWKISLDNCTTQNLNVKYIDKESKKTGKAYISFLAININEINLNQKSITIDNIELANSDIKLINNSISKNKKNTKIQETDWAITIENIESIENRFAYQKTDKKNKSNTFNSNDFILKNTNASIDKITLFDNKISGCINEFSFTEKCGLQLNTLSVGFNIDSQSIQLDNLNLTTPGSHVHSMVQIKYNNISDLINNFREVKFNVNFDHSIITQKDIAYIDKRIAKMESDVEISGIIKGKLGNFSGKNISLSTGKHTRFKGHVHINGFPNLKEMFIDFKVKQFSTNVYDLKHIYSKIKINPNFYSLGDINFKGRFTGFLNDFVANGELKTTLGMLSSDLNAKISGDSIHYSGQLASWHFNLGKLLGNDTIVKHISFNTLIEGQGLSAKTIDINFQGFINEFNINRYTYKRMIVDGRLLKQNFNGTFSISDPNLDLVFEGGIDFNSRQPIFDFTTEIRKANLDSLNFTKQNMTFHANAKIKLTGINLDSLKGTVNIDHLTINLPSKNIAMDSILFQVETKNDIKIIKLKSDIVHGNISGQFSINYLKSHFINTIAEVLPAFTKKQNIKNRPIQDFNFDIELHDEHKLFHLLFPNIRDINGFILTGKVNSQKDEFDINLSAKRLRYKHFTFKELQCNINKRETLNLMIKSDQINLTSKIMSLNNQINFTLSNDSIVASITSFDDSNQNYLHLNTLLRKKGDTIIGKVLPSKITINETDWLIDSNNNIKYYNGQISANRLSSNNTKSFISIQKNNIEESESVIALINNFEIGDFSQLFTTIPINGLVNGQISLSNIFDQPLLGSNLLIKNLMIGKDTIGNINIFASKNLKKPIVDVDASLTNKDYQVDLNGFYDIKNKNNKLNFSLNIIKASLSPLNTIFKKQLANTSGEFDGKIQIKGDFFQPILTGNIEARDFSFLLKYTNVTYNVKRADINSSKNYFKTDPVIIFDNLGNTIKMRGGISHNYLRDFETDLTFNAPRAGTFTYLNTNEKSNNSYYGKVMAYANFTIKGPIEHPLLKAKAKTMENTKIYIPINDDNEHLQLGFINFVNRSSDTIAPKQGKQSNKSIQLDIDLELTKQADIEIIFDKQASDVIKGNGSGNLKLVINESNEFSVFGKYFIDRGQYLFTLQSPIESIQLVNKKFNIIEGGNISWTGNPYEANINIDAVYKLRTTYIDWNVDNSTVANKNARINTEVHLSLEGSLLEPNINYTIRVPGEENDPFSPIAVKLNEIRAREDENRRQVFGLLVFNRPLPDNNNNNFNAVEDGTNTSVSEFLSKQLGKLASKIRDDIDLNLNLYSYQNLNAQQEDDPNTVNTRRELQVGLTKRFFNDRLSIDVGGNFNLSDNSQTTASAQQTNNFAGEFNIEYNLSKNQKLKVKAFRRNEFDIFRERNQNITGIGLSYKKDFNKLSDLWARYRQKEDKEEEQGMKRKKKK